MKKEREWTGKSRGGKTGYSIFVFLLRYFGLMPAYFLLVFVSLYFFLTSWKTNKHISNYLKKHNYSFLKRKVFIYRNYYVFGQTIIDKVVVMAGFKAKFTFNFDDEANLKRLISDNKGGVLMSAHVGNWEISGQLLYRVNAPINIVMLDAEYAQIKDYLNSISTAHKPKIIPIKEDLSHLFLILDAINKKELICLHADRVLDSDQKVLNKNFLGATANFPYSIFKLIVSLNIPVTFVFAFKETSTHYHFYATEPKQFDSGDKELDIISLSNDYVDCLERMIKKYPLQWFNYYDFWKDNKR